MPQLDLFSRFFMFLMILFGFLFLVIILYTYIIVTRVMVWKWHKKLLKQLLRIFNRNIILKIQNFVKFIIIEIPYLFIAIGLIFLLLYLRFLPRVARALWENLNQYQLLYLLLNLFLISIHIYFCLKLLNIIPTKPNPWLAKWAAKLHALKNAFFWLFINLYKFIWFILDAIAIKVFNEHDLEYTALRLFFSKFFKKKYFKRIYNFLLMLSLFPKIIFTTAFVYDVIYCNYFNYTFKCLPLLLIPLLEPIILYVLFDFYDTYWPDISAFLRKQETSEPDTAIYFFIPEFWVTPPSFVKDFQDFFRNHVIVLKNTEEFLGSYKDWKYNTSPYGHISLFLCIVRFLIFIFLLVYGLR